MHLLWDSRMVKRMLIQKGFNRLSREILAISSNTTRMAKGYIWEWAQEANRLNCKLVFNTDGHISPGDWEHALLELMGKGTRRIAHLIELILLQDI